MPISINRYISITSGVGSSINIGQRQLVLRLFDDNALIPTGTNVLFTNAAAVGAYFGTGSVEYARALFYFGWTSKNITQAPALSFARWNSAASAPQIFGAQGPQAVGSWTPITAGSFSLTMGGFTFTLSGMNFSAAGSLSAVAAVIQAAIQAESGGGAEWTGATVAWDSVNQRFDLTGGATGPSTISVAAGTGGSDVAGQLGWLSVSAILSQGAAVQTITQVLNQSATNDNNFGSFAFMATLSQNQIVEAATWNSAENNLFMYTVPCTSSNASALVTACANFDGVTFTLSPLSTEYPEQVPAMIMAATDYTKPNSTQNYMFQIFALTPSVLNDTDANTYDALRVNYYGQTQTAGQLVSFYQRGLMLGLPVDPLDQNIYANEQWLKDAIAASVMTLLLALNKVSANAQGRAQILSILQGVINQALLNGTISVGKTLSTVQQLYIASATGNPDAWRQVQNIGYWVDVQIVPVLVNNATEYQAQYTLVYSKNDVIRKVIGADILI